MKTTDVNFLGNKNQIDYAGFMQWVDNFKAQSRTPIQISHPAFDHFSVSSLQKIYSISHALSIEDRLKSTIFLLKEVQDWYVIAEAENSESAYLIPILINIAEASKERINLKIILAEDNPEWVFKNTGTYAPHIPKLFTFDKKGNQLFDWGPRPREAQKIFENTMRNAKGEVKLDPELQTWYEKNNGLAIQKELNALLSPYIDFDLLNEYAALWVLNV